MSRITLRVRSRRATRAPVLLLLLGSAPLLATSGCLPGDPASFDAAPATIATPVALAGPLVIWTDGPDPILTLTDPAIIEAVLAALPAGDRASLLATGTIESRDPATIRARWAAVQEALGTKQGPEGRQGQVVTWGRIKHRYGSQNG